MIHLFRHITLTGILLCASLPLAALDLDKEKRMYQQVADYVMDGDVEMLKANQHEFFSIYMESEELPAKGAVIIMHGRGYHPNWPELVYPLRTGLPAEGWSTLSIQMPVLDNESTFYDYLEILDEGHPRIQAAVDFLKQKNYTQIVLLAHSCSVHFSIDWLHKYPTAGATAFIGVGMGSTDKGQPMPAPFPLQDIKIPILDIRGELDYPAVIGNAPRRWEAMQQAGNSLSQQRVVKNADHYFTGQGEALLVQVVDWLNRLHAVAGN